MKQLLILFTIISIISCTKVEPLSPQEDQVQIDWNTELKKSEWIYHLLQLGVNEKWKFLNDSNIQSEIVRDGDTTLIIHTYRIIKDSFILIRPNYGSISRHMPIPAAIVWANLKLSNDTIFWRYHNMTEYKRFLIKNK